jgi:hypothetical protein
LVDEGIHTSVAPTAYVSTDEDLSAGLERDHNTMASQSRSPVVDR